VHVHGGAHAAVWASAGFHVLRMPERALSSRTVFWLLPARTRSKRPSRSRSVIGLCRARARVTVDLVHVLAVLCSRPSRSYPGDLCVPPWSQAEPHLLGGR
jgi:hypothetical protein